MRHHSLILAIAAACALGAGASGANAAVTSSPLGARAALSDEGVIEQVHCVPGWWHHAYRPHNGCWRPYAYYGGPAFAFRVGPRWGWHGGWHRGWRRW